MTITIWLKTFKKSDKIFTSFRMIQEKFIHFIIPKKFIKQLNIIIFKFYFILSEWSNKSYYFLFFIKY
jgi:hypothetical protein